MFYRKRLSVAAVVALLVHVLVLLPLIAYSLREPAGTRTVEAKERPIVLSLNDRLLSDNPPRRLIESGAAAEGPVEDSDLISNADSQAQDLSDVEGDTNQPHFEEASEFDELGTPPIPPPGQDPEVEKIVVPTLESAEEAPERSLEPQQTAQETAAEAPAVSEGITRVAGPPLEPEEEEAAVELMAVEPPPEEKAQEEPEEEPERIEVAQAPAQPTVQAQEIHSSRGREGGGADKSGFTSFEATKHVLGDYMLEVRRKVERQWRAALQLRYAGVSRTDSLVECSIRPDGTLEYVRIVEPGDSMSYAIICRDSIEKAGPFGPFPFDVPDIYRKENLEIVWKFSYL